MIGRDRHPAIKEVAKALSDLVEACYTSFGDDPQAGSPFAFESSELPRSVRTDAYSILAHAEMVAQFRMRAGIDFMDGLALVAASSPSGYPVFPLARAAMESFAYAAWVLDPDISGPQRAQRGALDHIKGVKQEIKNVRLLESSNAPDKRGVSASIAQYEQVRRYVDQDLKTARKVDPSKKQQTHPNARAVIGMLMNDPATGNDFGGALYGSLSGTTHASFASLVNLHHGNGLLSTFNLTIKRYVLPLAGVALALATASARYTAVWGLPPFTANVYPLISLLEATDREHGDEPVFQ